MRTKALLALVVVLSACGAAKADTPSAHVTQQLEIHRGLWTACVEGQRLYVMEQSGYAGGAIAIGGAC